MKKKRNLWTNIAFSIATVLILLSVVELGTRIVIYFRYGSSTIGMNAKFHYEPFLMTNSSPKNPLNKQFPPKKNTNRLLIIGGSTAENLTNEVIISAFQPIFPKKLEVLNLARGGYIINQERIALTLYGIRFGPDLIISLDGANDFVTMTKTQRPGIPYHGDFIKLGVEKPFLNFVFNIFRYSQFCNALLKLKERKVEKNVQNNNVLVEKTIEHYIESLFSVSVISKGLDVPYIIVLQPYKDSRKTITDREKKLALNYAYRKKFFTNLFSKLGSLLTQYPFPGKTFYVNGSEAFDNTNEECFVDEVHLTAFGEKTLLSYVITNAQNKGMNFIAARQAAGN